MRYRLADVHSTHFQASKMEPFAKIVPGEKLLTMFAKHFTLDV